MGGEGGKGVWVIITVLKFFLSFVSEDFFAKETKPKVGLCNCRTFFLN